MKRKKKSSLGFLFVLLMLLGGFLLGMGRFGDKVFLKLAQMGGPLLCQCQFSVKNLIWRGEDPLSFVWKDISIKNHQLEARASSIGFKVHGPWSALDRKKSNPGDPSNPLAKPWRLDLSLEGLDLNVEGGSAAPEKTKEPFQPASAVEAATRSLSHWSWLGARVQWDQVKIIYSLKTKKNLQFNWQKGEMVATSDKLRWQFSGQAQSPLPKMNFFVPIAFQGELLLKDKEWRVSDKTQLHIFNLPIGFAGFFNFANHSLELKAKASRAELSRWPLRLPGLFLRDWRGWMGFDFNLNQKNIAAPLAMDLHFSLEDFSAQCFWQEDETTVKGPLNVGRLEGLAHYDAVKGLDVSRFQWRVDGTGLEIKIPKYFEKEAQYPLSTQGALAWQADLKIEKAQWLLGPMQGEIGGQLNHDKRADLRWDIPLFALNGLAGVFPFLRAYPLTGKVSSKGHFKGLLTEESSMELKIESLLLDNVRGGLSWKEKDLSIEGPVALSLNGSIESKGRVVRGGRVQLIADLTALEINKKGLFMKAPRETLLLRMAAESSEGALRIRHGSLQGLFGQLDLKGQVPLPPVNAVDFRLTTDSFRLAPLKKWFPPWQDIIPAGQVKADITMAGPLNMEKIMESSFITKGRVEILIPKFAMGAPSSAAGSENKNVPPASVPAFLPDKPVMKNLDLELGVALGAFQWKQMSIENIQVRSRLQKGQLVGQASAGNIFGGEFQLQRLSLPMMIADPEVEYQARAKNLKLDEVLADLLTPFKGLASGNFNGEFKGHSVLPQSPHFLSRLRSQGNFKVQDAALHFPTLKEMILKKMGGAGPLKAFLEGLQLANSHLAIESQYRMGEEVLFVDPIAIQFQEGHRIHMNGRLGFDLMAQLKGELKVAQGQGGGGAAGIMAPGNSFFEANKDKEGRLVIPLEINGTLTKPEIKIIEKVIDQMVRKTIEYEKNKVVQRAQQQVNQTIESERKKIEDKVRGSLKKQAEDQLRKLFGK